MDLKEQELVQAAQNGNAAAFGDLYDRHIKSIYDFIYYKTWHKETAEDLTSQTFLKALNQLNRYTEKKAGFSTWLYQIARNTVIDHYRTQKFDKPIEDAWDLSSSDDVLEQVDANLRLEEVKEVLSGLKSEQRDLILLRVWQQKSYAEIAEILGKSEASCKMAYSRAIKELRGMIPLAIYLFLLLRL